MEHGLWTAQYGLSFLTDYPFLKRNLKTRLWTMDYGPIAFSSFQSPGLSFFLRFVVFALTFIKQKQLHVAPRIT